MWPKGLFLFLWGHKCHRGILSSWPSLNHSTSQRPWLLTSSHWGARASTHEFGGITHSIGACGEEAKVSYEACDAFEDSTTPAWLHTRGKHAAVESNLNRPVTKSDEREKQIKFVVSVPYDKARGSQKEGCRVDHRVKTTEEDALSKKEILNCSGQLIAHKHEQQKFLKAKFPTKLAREKE